MQVLVVDDDMATVEVIVKNVNWEKLGVRNVFKAHSVASAKKIIEENEIDIIVSDIEMPQGSGLQLLEWYRKNGYNGEFILLTCHESFDYATNAIKFHATEYLLKPFDVNVMEAALRKIISYSRKNKDSKRTTNFFLKEILSGHIEPDKEEIKAELRRRKAELKAEEEYVLVLSKITGVEKDTEKMNQSLVYFIAENLHSEILCGNPEIIYVAGTEYRDFYCIATVCHVSDPELAEEKCKKLISEFKKILMSDITCVVSNKVYLWEFYDTYRRCLDLLRNNIVINNGFFREKDCCYGSAAEKEILEYEILEKYIDEKKKIELLSYIKEKLNDKTGNKTLDANALKQMQQEILQAVYMYLGKRMIPASGLLQEDNLQMLTEKALTSQMNMVKWVNFLLERTYVYEQEEYQKSTLAEKINLYVSEHFKEDINRNSIAKIFFMTPENLSKTYKKQTGQSLNDYISCVRINNAKLLLERGERVSDAAEAVGFSDFTYFSTIFKKITGLTPNQYKSHYNS